ncbi:MAG: phosphatase PAP2 family protein [Bdellovibrio sp.]|nr:phosphatase PAP2 family protein [Bdellovibrio sp.]
MKESFLLPLIVIFLLGPIHLGLPSFAAEPVEKNEDLSKLKFDAKDDFLQSMKWAYQGSYLQFSSTQNLVFTAVAIGAIGYFIYNDKMISEKAVRENKNEGFIRLVSKSSIFFNTPVLPMAFYYWGRNHQDAKMVRFSQEYLAALFLTLAETAAISIIPVHQRPDNKDLSFIETAFRGQSSFPSGHVVGYTVLGFKSLQFYGPEYALLPLGLAVATAFERVHSEKHYASDVIASSFIALLASEGVRYASNYDKNHPIYEWIFKHEFTLQYIRSHQVPGLQASVTF